MKIFLFVLGSVAGASAQNCSQVLAPLQLNETAPMVAHATHSLTLNMIRHYFNPEAREDNGIATVNLNRRQDNDLHDNAPLVNLTNSIDYPPFFALDCILSNIDNRKYGIKNANFKDRIAHDLHMHHMWETASMFYKQLVDNPPEDDVCPCLLDTYQEEILKHLGMIAKEIRIPNKLAGDGKKRYYYLGVYLGRYIGVYYYRNGNTSNSNPNLYPNNIKDEASWEQWKELMKDPYNGYREDVGWNMAYYMYCMLNTNLQQTREPY